MKIKDFLIYLLFALIGFISTYIIIKVFNNIELVYMIIGGLIVALICPINNIGDKK